MFKTCLLIVVLAVSGALSAEPSLKTVTMKSISYDPKILEIQVGDAVEWINKSYTEHSATGELPADFDTGLISPKGKTKKIVFKTPGTFRYHCSVHGRTMSGEIVVKAQ